MNKFTKIFVLAIITILFYSFFINNYVIIQQVKLNGNNINAWFLNTGIFDQDKRATNTPGFEWPKGSGKFACFTAGLCGGCFVQDSLREFMCSYAGELAPGYIIDSAGNPKAKADFRFRIWKVNRTDNPINNNDWLNWGLMVPYGAPFVDVNHNNFFDPLTDTPGVSGASQVLFACLTDGFPEEHKLGEGFGGGTLPMFAEIRLTAWCYNNPGLEDIQYLRWQIINKNKYSWDSTHFTLLGDPDLGNPTDNYMGCDTIRELSYVYNGDDDDEQGSNNYNYGLHPPAFGFKFLRTAKLNSVQIGMTSFTSFYNTSSSPSQCVSDPNGESFPAYYMMTGIKKDRTPWVIPPGGNQSLITKYIYSGDPETGQGWNEGLPGSITGGVWNCGGPHVLNGFITVVNVPEIRRLLMTTGSKFLKVNPGDTQIIVAAQLIARGSSNLNSVTKLKQLSDIAQNFYDTQFPIGVTNGSSSIPSEYKLYQNYPNPFNPSTKIRFYVRTPLPPFAKGGMVSLKIYDILGREITTLVKEQLIPGTYEVEWNAYNHTSGIYFYSLIIDGKHIDTKKMVLLK